MSTQPMGSGPFDSSAATGNLGTGPLPKKRNVFGVWIGLPLITLGIYTVVWHYKINRETKFNPSTQVNPWVSVLAVTLGAFVIIPVYVSVYKTGERIAAAQRAAGITTTCNGWIGLLLAFVFSLHSLYYQSEMNKLIDTYPGANEGDQVPLRAAG